MADHPMNAVNRGVYISDNLPFLQSLNDGCIDLVCIDPPFAKNETFGRKNSKAPDPLKQPLSDEEKATEAALLHRCDGASGTSKTPPPPELTGLKRSTKTSGAGDTSGRQ